MFPTSESRHPHQPSATSGRDATERQTRNRDVGLKSEVVKQMYWTKFITASSGFSSYKRDSLIYMLQLMFQYDKLLQMFKMTLFTIDTQHFYMSGIDHPSEA